MKRRSWIAAASAGAATLVLVACSSSGSSTPTSSGSGTGAGTGAAKTAATKSDAVFTFGQTAGVTQLDPNVSALLSENVYFSLLYNGLTKYGPDGTVKPDLATSWKPSSDGLTWTFKLRSGVKFADGRAFTATDAVQNIERVLNPKVTSQWRTNISMVTKAVATDPTTLTLTLKSASSQLPTSLIPVKMTDVAKIANVNKDPNGTGPYKLKSFIPNDTLDLVANPSYWGGKPKMAEIKIVSYPQETAAETALRSGTLTAFWNPAATAIASLRSGHQVLSAKDPGGLDVFELDTTSAPFNNPKARQALAYATDRDAMVKAAFGGNAVANTSQTFVSPTNKFHDKSLPNYGYNLDKAKQLFSEAGVTKLTYWTISGAYPEMAIEGQILQQDLAKIGVTLDIKASESNTWAAKFYPNGKRYPGLVVSNELSFQPAPDLFAPQWFSSKGTCECNWKPPAAYDDGVAALQAADSDDARGKALDTIQQNLNAGSPIVIIANSSPVTVAQSSVQGAWEESDGVLHLEDAGLTS